jgi:hypothetical protein
MGLWEGAEVCDPGSTGFQPVGTPLPHKKTFHTRLWGRGGQPMAVSREEAQNRWVIMR